MLTHNRFPKENPRSHTFLMVILCALSLAFFVLWKFLPQKSVDVLRREMIQASRLMEDATDILRACRERKGLPIDRSTDINGTGIIGLENSEITTSIGNLGSKRTSTNSNFAGLVVRLLGECGVEKGDCVAVGASGVGVGGTAVGDGVDVGVASAPAAGAIAPPGVDSKPAVPSAEPSLSAAAASVAEAPSPKTLVDSAGARTSPARTAICGVAVGSSDAKRPAMRSLIPLPAALI